MSKRYPTEEARAAHAAEFKAWRIKNPEKQAASVARNQEGHRKSSSKSAAKRRKEKTAEHLLSVVRWRSGRLGIPFNLTLEDLVIPKFCPVLGIPITPGEPASRPGLPTVDRIRPHLGYVKGNVKIISHRANKLKNDASLEEARMIVAYLEREIGNVG